MRKRSRTLAGDMLRIVGASLTLPLFLSVYGAAYIVCVYPRGEIEKMDW